MLFTFDTRIFLLICCLLQGLAGLRMIKVTIPAYKLRGESAFLECQYELDKTMSRKHFRYQDSEQEENHDGVNNMNYVNPDSTESHFPQFRHIQSYPFSQTHQHTVDSIRTVTNYQHQLQADQPNSDSHYEPYQYPYQTPKSPYGHSIYRGRSPVSYGGHVGASTYSRSSHNSYGISEHEESTDDSKESEQEEEKEEEDVGEELYAIKWYKDNEEFYRYLPKANPPKTSYRVDGVRVVEEHSDDSRVLIRGLTINSTGLYSCEVSAEAPNFSSVKGEGQLYVVFLPRDGPHIRGQQFQYQIGETLSLNCSSGKSHPASHLQWFINEQLVTNESSLVRYNNTVHKHGLITSTLGLQLTVEPSHFHDGAMRVKCLASISPVLWKGNKESVLQRRPGIINNREAMLLVRSATSSIHQWNNLSCWRLLTITAILTMTCQLLLRRVLT